MASSSQWGAMVDFLRANPYVGKEEYLWEWTLPQVHIAAADFTYTEYLSEKQAKAADKGVVYENPEDFLNDFGMPIAGG